MIVVIIYSVLGFILPRRVNLPPQQEENRQKEERRRMKIVLVKPWKVVDFKASPTTDGVRVDPDQDDTDIDNASIQGRLGEHLQEGAEENFVSPGTKESVSVASERYLGTMTANYLPALARIDSAIVIDKFELRIKACCPVVINTRRS